MKEVNLPECHVNDGVLNEVTGGENQDTTTPNLPGNWWYIPPIQPRVGHDGGVNNQTSAPEFNPCLACSNPPWPCKDCPSRRK